MIGKVHSGLNQSKGILFDRDHDLDGVPEQEIKSEWESQGKVSVKCFTKKPEMTWLNLQILTIAMPTLFSYIKVRLYQMKIYLFGTNQLRCFKCQRFGHGQNTCKSCETCWRGCLKTGMTAKAAQKNPICKNCNFSIVYVKSRFFRMEIDWIFLAPC